MRHLRSTLLLASAAALAACSDQAPPTGAAGTLRPAAAPLHAAAAGQGIDGSYIVVVKEGADPRSVAAVVGVSPKWVYTAALNVVGSNPANTPNRLLNKRAL